MELKFKVAPLFILIFILLLSYAIAEDTEDVLPKVRSASHKKAKSGVNGNDEIASGDAFNSNSKVSVSTVALLTAGMAGATGLGALPFFFIELDPQWAGICNGMAAGVMLAASFDLIQEGRDHGSGNSVVIGILAGGIFIWLCKKVLEQYGEVSMLDIKGADATKALLVIGIMTLHSFGEGSGVGVSFAGSKGLSQGLFVTLAIAVHNIPEGLAVSMVLASRGVSPQNAMIWSVITSLPQPIVAVPSFICADAFNKFLPLCTGFAAGCMIWMVIAEVLPDGFKEASPSHVAASATLSVAFMEALSTVFQMISHRPDDAYGFLVSLLFGLGPFLGGIALVSFALSLRLQRAVLTGVASGIALVLTTWRPLHLLLASKISLLRLFSLLSLGTLFSHALTTVLLARALSKRSSSNALPSLNIPVTAPTLISLVACAAVAFHALCEGIALGIAAPKAYGFGRHMLLPVSLHGFPRGAAVASCMLGATSSWHGGLVAAAVVGMMGPASAMGTIVSRVEGYGGLDGLMVLACGGLVPGFGRMVGRGMRVDARRSGWGMGVGVIFAGLCLMCTKLVCLHTPYCNSAPEGVR